jgi:DNA-binding CsgD family transcriptional regulator
MFRKLVFVFFLSFATILLGQVSSSLGTPFIKNFTEEEINNDLNVFDISQNINGEMYFATPKGLLEYDGTRWKKYTYKLESDLRSVFYKDDTHIYTSGHGGFGFWSKNNVGTLEYTSLYFKKPKKDDVLLPIFFRIKEIQGKIFFQTFQQVYIYDPATNGIEIIDAIKGFNVLFSSNGRAFIQDQKEGLFEINKKERSLIIGKQVEDLHISGVFIQNSKELLIVTKNSGIWSWKDEKLLKNDWALNSVLEKYLVNDVQEFEKDKLIIGTVRNGVYIVSFEGEVLLHLEKNNGLINNTVRRVYADLNNNLWLGMDNGLSYLQIKSNTNYLIDSEGEFGTVFTSHIKDSLLYLGTNQGLFVKNILIPLSKPRLMDKNLGQIWEIKEIDTQILIGSHEGVFSIENKKLKNIHFEAGAWTFRKHPDFNDILYVGFYSGVGVFKKVNGTWKFLEKWENFGESSRFIEFDKYGQLWVAHPSKGYYRLVLSDDGFDLKEVEFYGVSNKFVDAYAYFSKIDGDLVLYNPNGFFNYEPIDNTFIKAKYPSEVFKDLKNINNIYQSQNIFWYSTPESLGYVKRSARNFHNISEPFYSIRNKHLGDFNKFNKLNDSIFSVGIRNGVVFHTIEKRKKINTPPTIRSIELISTKDTILAPLDEKNIIDIPNRNNFLKISIAMPKIPLANSKKIQYKLNGLNKDWSDWGFVSELNFPGLLPGNYTLELRAGGENEIMSKIITRGFFIKSPWYLTKLAVGFYGILLLLIHLFYRSYFRKKSLKQIIYLKEKEANKRSSQEEKFKLEKLETERELLILREENLSLEIKKKDSALASSTLNNIKKNELLAALIKDIKNIDNELVNSSLHYPVKNVIKKINNHLVDKEDWLTFQLHFSNSHAKFFQNLREKHADLSSNEIKLSAYLKLNLSSKEIASLMNVAVTSVEQSRYRLRKKINLDKDVNLVNYLQEI